MTISVMTGERAGYGRPTEDRIFLTSNAVVVLDGVSTLSDQAPAGGWYAQPLGERVAGRLIPEAMRGYQVHQPLDPDRPDSDHLRISVTLDL